MAEKLGHERRDQRRSQTNQEIFELYAQMPPTEAQIEDNLSKTKTKNLSAQEDMIKKIHDFEKNLESFSSKNTSTNSEGTSYLSPRR